LAMSFVGVCGLHRFYLRQFKSGFIYLLTFGLFGIGTLTDVFTINILIRRAERIARRKRLELQPFTAFRHVAVAEMMSLQTSLSLELWQMVMILFSAFKQILSVIIQCITNMITIIWRVAIALVCTCAATAIDASRIIVSAIYMLVKTALRAIRLITAILYEGTSDEFGVLSTSILIIAKIASLSIWRVYKGFVNILRVQYRSFVSIISAALLAFILRGFQFVDSAVKVFNAVRDTFISR